MSLRLSFDQGPLGQRENIFEHPLQILTAYDARDVAPLFEALQETHQQGYWIAGFANYELGFALCSKLSPFLKGAQEQPLCVFGVYSAPSRSKASKHKTKHDPIGPLQWQPSWSMDTYEQAFQQVHDYISAGDIYQANLTFSLTASYQGSSEALYAALCERQEVSHGALVEWDTLSLLSRSPELFFTKTASGQLTARPMKGTAPRGFTRREDQLFYEELYNSVKNRAENVMIVDLLRNDMSRISEIGSVKVPHLFDIETYQTVHQMTSTITSQIKPDVTIRQIFEALFPCGSIVGAPKIRAMEILHELESGPRGPYCGSIGWIAPSGDMAFNVAIRTLVHDRSKGQLTLQVGGGIVHDSTAAAEYNEALLKSKFAQF